MSKILTTVLLLLTVLSCQKTYDKPAATTTVDQLNSRQYDSVIASIDPETASPQDRFYLASAYAGRGQLDVFVLYPLLEMYLFNRPAMEWDDLSDVKDPYRRFMRRMGREGSRTEEQRESMRAEYQVTLRARHNIDDVIPDCPGATPEYYEQLLDLDRRYLAQYEEDLRAGVDISYPSYSYSSAERLPYDPYSTENRSCSYKFWDRWNRYHNYYFDLKNFGFGGEDAQNEADGDPESIEISTSKAQSLVMEALWHTYEAIPLLNRVPVVPLSAQDDLTSAINLMMTLRQDPALKDRAIQSITAWSVVSLLSVYRTGFDLERSATMQDMFCGFDLTKVIDYYPVIRERFRVFNVLHKEADISERQREQLRRYAEAADKYFEESPENLTGDQKRQMVSGFREYQLRQCVNMD